MCWRDFQRCSRPSIFPSGSGFCRTICCSLSPACILAFWSIDDAGAAHQGRANRSHPNPTLRLDASPCLRNDGVLPVLVRNLLSISFRQTLDKFSIRNEAILLAVLLGFGVLMMPGAAYLFGRLVFGEYVGDGFGDFFASIGAKLVAADGVAWLLVASPYLFLQCLRLTLGLWRRLGPLPRQ